MILKEYFCERKYFNSKEWDFCSLVQFYWWSSMYFSLCTQIFIILEVVSESGQWEQLQISYHNFHHLLRMNIIILLCFFHLKDSLFFMVFAIFVLLNYLLLLLQIHFQSFLIYPFLCFKNDLSYKDPKFSIEFESTKIKFLDHALSS